MSARYPFVAALLYCFAVLGGGICSAQVSFQGDFLNGQKYGIFDTWGLAVGDFNGDGKLDIVGVNANENAFAVYLGNGDGTFQGGLTHAVTGEPNFPMSVTTADINGDGNLDLVVANFNVLGVTGGGAISVFLGNGNGTFQPQVDYVVPTHPSSVVAADLNGDGKLDLVVTVNDTASVAILLNNGDGTFQPPVSYGAGNGPFSQVLSDFNGDGKPDIIVTNYCNLNANPNSCSSQFYGTVSILLGNGDGTFQAAKAYAAGVAPHGIAIGDFNQNGKKDVVVTDSSSGATVVLLGNGDGTLQPPVAYPGDGGGFVVVGDFDSDGKQEVVSTGTSVTELLEDGAGTFQPTIDYYRSTPGEPYFYAAMGDFNGDGHPDIAVGFETVFSVFLNAASTVRQPTTTAIQTVYNGCGSLTVSANVTSGTGPVPTGTVTLEIDGQYFAPQFGNLDGAGNASVDSLLTPGIHNITVVYSGDSSTAASSASVSVSIQQVSQTLLLSNLNPSTFAQAVNFTATVSPSAGAVLPNAGACLQGSITFLDSTSVLAIVPLGLPHQPYNEANFTTSTLSVGNHSITAVYGGAPYISPSTSPALVQVVGADTSPSLGLGVASGSSSSQTVTAGQTATYNLTIGGQGINGTATFTCTGSPSAATCTVPSSLGVSANSATTFSVTVISTARSLASLYPGSSFFRGMWAMGVFGLLWPPIVRKRKRPPMRVLQLLAVFLVLTLYGCGGGSSSMNPPPASGTPAGTYTLTITANSGATSQSIPLTLIVQ